MDQEKYSSKNRKSCFDESDWIFKYQFRAAKLSSHNRSRSFPSRKTVETFLRSIVFAPNDGIGSETKKRVADFVENAIKNFHFAGEYPSKLSVDEIKKLTAETHLILGERDGLIPFQNIVKRAEKFLPNIKSVKIFSERAHVIEVSSDVILQLHNITGVNTKI